MSLKLMYITNDTRLAEIAENQGVDWIFVDLEIIGKEKRQPKMDTVKSNHTIEDVKKIKKVIKNSKLLVRVNPIYEDSFNEINRVIEAGADIVMLPYFKTIEEVILFAKIVNSSAKKCLLLETPEAVEIIDQILLLDTIDYIHIGLNDLHLGYKKKFMFELLADNTVDNIIEKIQKTDVVYGFGGVAKIGEGTLRSELIINEHYRLKSNLVILSRTFYRSNDQDSYQKVEKEFYAGIRALRDYESKISGENEIFFKDSHKKLVSRVNQIVKRMD